MRQKLFISALFIFCFGGPLLAQQVTRKGMKPTPTGNSSERPAKYSIDQLNGKWQEVKRSDGGNTEQSFRDTLLLSVNNGKGFVRDIESMNMQMQGSATIGVRSTLEIAGDTYTIKTLDSSMLTLADDDAIHVMKKVPAFRFEGEGKDSITWAPNNVMSAVDLKGLAGKWMVYRKQAAPGFIDDQTILIKAISFLSYANGVVSGEIVTYDKKNISEVSPCVFNFSDGKLNIIYKGITSSVNVYKATPAEFTFGDEKGVMNYAKH